MLVLECLEPTGSLYAKHTRTHTVAAVFLCFLFFFFSDGSFSALLGSAVYRYFCHDFVQLLFFSEDDVAVCCFCCPLPSLPVSHPPLRVPAYPVCSPPATSPLLSCSGDPIWNK